MISSSSAPPIRSTRDRRAPVRAATSRRRWRSPRKRISAPSRSPPRAASSARSRACRARWRRSHGSRSARNDVDVALRVRPAAPAGRRHGHDDAAVRMDARRAGRAIVATDGACSRSGPPGSIATAAVSVTPAVPPARDGRRSGRGHGSPQHASRPLAGLGTVEDRRSPVDDDVLDAARIAGPARA